MNRDCAEVCDVRQRLLAVDNEETDLALRIFGPDLFYANPRRHKSRRVLLIERLALDTIGIAREHHWPVLEIGQHPFRNRPIVRDQVAFRVTLFGEKDFIWVGDGRSRITRAILRY